MSNLYHDPQAHSLYCDWCEDKQANGHYGTLTNWEFRVRNAARMIGLSTERRKHFLETANYRNKMFA